MKTFLLPFIAGCFLLISFGSNSQELKGKPDSPNPNKTPSNQLDSLGMKQGLWIEKNGAVEVYYRNNLREGVYRSYSLKSKSLAVFGEYSMGKPVGKWYFFNDEGQLLFTEERIEENTSTIWEREDGVKIKPKFTSYVKMFYPNGNLQAEGQALYEDEIQVDFYKTGIWQYYDRNGILSEKKVEH
ncbi:MAG: hypothetical protein L6Q78_15685 [Bacteroidia bacterium]|nr:hypothetical protein [Bacteroidia bacterium]